MSLRLESRVGTFSDIVTGTLGPLSILQCESDFASEDDGMNAAVKPVAMTTGDAYPHLPNAPIIEAVVDWRTKPGPSFDIKKLKEQALKLVAPQYQFLDEQRGFQYVL